MKARLALPVILSFAMLACADSDGEYSANETAPAVNDEAETSGDWMTLFDGSSFEHWRGYQQESMPDGWKIVDSAMFMEEPSRDGDIVTKEQFANFELRFEWMVPEGGNSGVMFRVSEDYDNPWATGPEYQVLDDAYHTDGKDTKHSAGSNYDVYAPSEPVAKPAGEWNTGRLLVDGAHVEHWLNGVKIVEYELWSDQWKADVAASKWVDHSEYGMLETGHIALQGDHTGVSYRNIEIRIL